MENTNDNDDSDDDDDGNKSGYSSAGSTVYSGEDVDRMEEIHNEMTEKVQKQHQIELRRMRAEKANSERVFENKVKPDGLITC